MTVNKDAVGKQWPPVTYEVGLEKIREYARAVGETNPVHLDREAALAAGFRDVVAPPMFCVVYSAPAMGPAVLDPEVGINLAAMVHGKSLQAAWTIKVTALPTGVAAHDIDELFLLLRCEYVT
jgi:hypothetical protein